MHPKQPGVGVEQITTLRDGETKPSSERPKVLVVEDNPLNAKLILAQLEQGGYRAISVESGEAALAALAATSYLLVLMDCGLPGIDGCTTTREIRLREAPERHMIVIGLSSNTAESARAACLEAGMDGYIERPVTTSELLTQIRRLSSRSESTATSDKGTERPDSISGMATETLDTNVLAELASLPGADGSSLLVQLIEIFIRNLPEMLRNLLDARRAGSKELAQAAHRLKSAATTLGASRLAAVCKTLEEFCGHDDQSTLEKLLAEVPLEAGRLTEKLKEIRSATH